MTRWQSKFDRLKEGMAACRTSNEATDFWNEQFDEINGLEPHQIESLIVLRDRHEGAKA